MCCVAIAVLAPTAQYMCCVAIAVLAPTAQYMCCVAIAVLAPTAQYMCCVAIAVLAPTAQYMCCVAIAVLAPTAQLAAPACAPSPAMSMILFSQSLCYYRHVSLFSSEGFALWRTTLYAHVINKRRIGITLNRLQKARTVDTPVPPFLLVPYFSLARPQLQYIQNISPHKPNIRYRANKIGVSKTQQSAVSNFEH